MSDAKHSLRIDYDDATGEARVTHRCVVDVGGLDVSHSEEVALNDPEGTAAALAGFVGANRAEMEKRTTALAAQHAAAVAGRAGKNVKQLTVGGALAASGDTAKG